MRFLVDECTGPKVAQWLRDQGHEVFEEEPDRWIAKFEEQLKMKK